MTTSPALKTLRPFWGGIVVGLVAGIFTGVILISWYVVHKGFNPVNLDQEAEVTAAFHRVYHNNWWDRTVLNTYWMGVQTMQCPLDMWVLQEIINETSYLNEVLGGFLWDYDVLNLEFTDLIRVN